MPLKKTALRGARKFIEFLTGQEFDKEYQFYNYGARLYDPVMGRFITPDSIVPDWYDPQSLNSYSYSLNNPLRYNDPTGHAANEWFLLKTEAAHDFGMTYNDDSIRNKAEYGSSFYRMKNAKGEWGWAYTVPSKYRGYTTEFTLPKRGVMPEGNIHTHITSENFGPEDIGIQNGTLYELWHNHEDMFLCTPGGALKILDPEIEGEEKIQGRTIAKDLPSNPESKNRLNDVDPEENPVDDPCIDLGPFDSSYDSNQWETGFWGDNYWSWWY